MIGDYLQSTIILNYISKAEIYYHGIHSEPQIFLQLDSVGWSLRQWVLQQNCPKLKVIQILDDLAFDKDPSAVCLD